MKTLTVGELVRRASRGDRDGWDELVNRYGRLVWAVALSHGLSHADAADVTQTTWLRLAERLTKLRDPDKVRAWLVTTAKNESLRLLQSSSRTVPLDTTRVVSAVPTDVADGLLARERSTALWSAFERLPASCRTLLRLLISDPAPSYVEISETLGIPVGSIGPTRSRCLARLRERAARFLEEPDTGIPRSITA